MAQPIDRQAFFRVFSDARIIDIDLSEWDKRIDLWTLADHYEDWTGRCPVVVVEFYHVKSFSCSMPDPKNWSLPENEHRQWDICEFEIKESSLVSVRLPGARYSPDLEIECEYIRFRKSNVSVLDQKLPGWNNPYLAFVRPGIEKLPDIDQYSV